MVGEIGGNDCNYPLLQGRTIEEVMFMVPDMVQAIKDAVKRVIGFGAQKIIVSGDFPIGSLPAYRTKFQSNEGNSYDKFNCAKQLNNFSMYHNEKLQQAIRELKIDHPTVNIAYGDYYNAYLWILPIIQKWVLIEIQLKNRDEARNFFR